MVGNSEYLSEARALLVSAIAKLDEASAPAHIAAHADHALCRLNDLLAKMDDHRMSDRCGSGELI